MSAIEDFSSNVKEMFEVQDQIRAIAADAKDKKSPLKERADELESGIRDYMSKSGIDVCNYQDERLELKTVTRFGSLTKKSLESALEVYFQDSAKAEACFAAIMEQIGSKELTVLKRLKNRKRKAPPSGDVSQPERKQAAYEDEAPPDLSDED